MRELKRRAKAYFAGTVRSKRDCRRMYLKTAVVLAWLATSKARLMFAAPTVRLVAFGRRTLGASAGLA